MAAESGQKETPVPVCRKRPRKGVQGQHVESAARVPTRQLSPQKNFSFRVDGVPVEYQRGGETIHDRAMLVDWKDVRNEWLAVNQMTIVGANKRRTDILIYLNGLPLVVMELKGLCVRPYCRPGQLRSCGFRPPESWGIVPGTPIRQLGLTLDRFSGNEFRRPPQIRQVGGRSLPEKR